MAGVLRKIFGFHYLSLKLSLTLLQKDNMLRCSYFRSFIKSINLDRCGNFIKKFNFVSTPSKIIIPTANHPPYHPLNTPSPMPPPTLPPPPTTSLTRTPHIPPPTDSTTTHHLTSPYTTTHPTTPIPPWRKSRALMPDISSASPHSLPIR